MRYNTDMKMARIIIALALLPIVAATVLAETSVLFIGNSHTGANDLPGLFEGLALAGSHDVHVDRSVVGGSSLAFHFDYELSRQLIIERDWDRVVLQEHSLYPVIEHWRDEVFFPAARDLDELITSSGSKTALFMTWGYEDAAGPYCIGGYCSREFDDYLDMQSEVTASYTSIAFELNAMLAPVGEAFAAALAVDPSLPLWLPDGYHPSPDGSYLAACVFFHRLFSESPEGLDFHGGLDPARALFYQQIAAEASGVPTPAHEHFGLTAFPNPFNPRTEIRFTLARSATVGLAIYDGGGRLVRELYPGTQLSAGDHGVEWKGRDDQGCALPSGIYLLRLSVDDGSATRKLIILK